MLESAIAMYETDKPRFYLTFMRTELQKNDPDRKPEGVALAEQPAQLHGPGETPKFSYASP